MAHDDIEVMIPVAATIDLSINVQPGTLVDKARIAEAINAIERHFENVTINVGGVSFYCTVTGMPDGAELSTYNPVNGETGGMAVGDVVAPVIALAVSDGWYPSDEDSALEYCQTHRADDLERLQAATPTEQLRIIDGEWSGAPDPTDSDNFWIDDKTGERVDAKTGGRSPAHAPRDGMGSRLDGQPDEEA